MNTVEEDSILAGLFQDVAWIRVIGKGTFQNAPALKAFAKQRIEEGQEEIVIDLEDCPCMDSTFMGTITAIALQLRARTEGQLQVINTNERTAKSLQELGLDQILDLDLNDSVWSEERALVRENITRSLVTEPLPQKECRQIVLEAHEALCQANQDNVARFRNVLDYLKKPEDGEE